MSDPTTISDPQRALITARVIWAMLCMGVMLLGGVMVFVTLRVEAREQDAAIGNMALLGAAVVTLLALPVALFIRSQMFKRGWVGEVVTPSAYVTGNIVPWAVCEGAAIFGFIAMFLDRSIMPGILMPVVAMLFLLLLFPNGRAMFPRDAQPRRTLATGEYDRRA